MDGFDATKLSKLILDRLKPILYNYNTFFFNTNLEGCIAISMEAHYNISPETFIRGMYGDSVIKFVQLGSSTYNIIIKDVDHKESWSRIK